MEVGPQEATSAEKLKLNNLSFSGQEQDEEQHQHRQDEAISSAQHVEEEEEEEDDDDDGDDEGWGPGKHAKFSFQSPGTIATGQESKSIQSLNNADPSLLTTDIILRCRLARLELPNTAFPGIEKEQLVVTCELILGEFDDTHNEDVNRITSCISSLPTSYQPQRGDVCWDQRLDLSPISLRHLGKASRLVFWLWSLARGEYPVANAIVPLYDSEGVLCLGTHRLYLSTQMEDGEDMPARDSSEGSMSVGGSISTNGRTCNRRSSCAAIMEGVKTQQSPSVLSPQTPLSSSQTPKPRRPSLVSKNARLRRAMSEPVHDFTSPLPLSASISTAVPNFVWPSHGYLVIQLYAKEIEKTEMEEPSSQSNILPSTRGKEAVGRENWIGNDNGEEKDEEAEEEEEEEVEEEERSTWIVIEEILSRPSDRFDDEVDQQLLWENRKALIDDSRSLVKCLQCAEYGDEASLSEYVSSWRERLHVIPLVDALKLLSGEFSVPSIRSLGMERLRLASNDEILVYMVQLVQLLRHEPWESSSNSSSSIDLSSSGFQQVTNFHQGEKNTNDDGNILSSLPMNMTPLARFLIHCACHSLDVANSLYWHVSTEMHDRTHGRMFEAVRFSFLYALLEENHQVYTMITVQAGWFKKIEKIHGRVLETSHLRERKQTMLRELLVEEEVCKVSVPIPLPTAPSTMVNCLSAKSASIFGSKTYPAFIPFHLDQGGDEDEDEMSPTDGENESKTVMLIFKSGEDLRQDQLIVQIISILDKLLKTQNQLDLRLTHYHVLATGPKEGLLEYVPDATTVSEILATKGKIHGFLRSQQQTSASTGALEVVMENYVRSLAGYCVITHVLGIGDRHLHNLMIRSDGRFFHLDFGFILGSDPKPMPGPFRLSTPMIDGMGGREHPNYEEFKTLCVKAFKALRGHAPLIISSISLMIDANLKDFSKNGRGEREPTRILQKLEERFRLDLDDDEAEEHFLSLINKALSAVAPRVHEAFHNLAVR